MAINALVIDDSGIMRKMIMRALSDSGLAAFSFTEATDGLDALEKFNPKSTEMLFVDWNMPNMSGIDFIRKIREIEKDHVPTIMITTESTMGKVEEAMDDADVDCFIVKPFTPDVLHQKLGPLFDSIKAGDKKGGFFTKLAAKM